MPRTKTQDRGYYFRPKDDITAYELCYILQYITDLRAARVTGIVIDENTKTWIDAPNNVKRHFARAYDA